MPFSQPVDFQPLPSRDSLGVYHASSRLLGEFETFRAKMGEGESRELGRSESSGSSQIPLYVHQTTKARQLSLTGLVGIETGCGARLSGGGRLDSQQVSKLPKDAIASLFG